MTGSAGLGSLAGAARPLAITCLNLACCALEVADGVELWERIRPDDSPGAASGPPLNVLVVAGTVTRANSALVADAFAGLAEPRAVVAFGACTISGGPYWDSYAVLPGIAELVPVTVMVPGCPPHPQDLAATLSGLADAVVAP